MSSNRKSATSRLRQDYLRLKRDPVPNVNIEPLPSNILEWHFVVNGPEYSSYEGGYYHGKIVFPKEFPFKPPAVYMITPIMIGGRIRINSKLCLSISHFHPDSWNPAWNVSTILTGLLSFMIEESVTMGSIVTTTYEHKELAYKTLNFNLRNTLFCELFPDIVTEMQNEIDKRAQNANQQRPAASSLQFRLTNLTVFLGCIAYILYRKFVMKTTYTESDRFTF